MEAATAQWLQQLSARAIVNRSAGEGAGVIAAATAAGEPGAADVGSQTAAAERSQGETAAAAAGDLCLQGSLSAIPAAVQHLVPPPVRGQLTAGTDAATTAAAAGAAAGVAAVSGVNGPKTGIKSTDNASSSSSRSEPIDLQSSCGRCLPVRTLEPYLVFASGMEEQCSAAAGAAGGSGGGCDNGPFDGIQQRQASQQQDEGSEGQQSARSTAEGCDCQWHQQGLIQRYAVPPARVSKYYRVLDVVTPDSTYCNCFTKGYGKNILGSGSVLASRAAGRVLCSVDERGRLHLKEDPYSSRWDQGLQQQHHQQQEQQKHCDHHQQQEQQQEPGMLEGQQLEGYQYQQPGRQDSCAISSMKGQKEGDEALDGRHDETSCLRFFTPREIANIHGLPQATNVARDHEQQERVANMGGPGFSFPKGVTNRQAYALLGNSLSVDVVAVLMTCLLKDWAAHHMGAKV